MEKDVAVAAATWWADKLRGCKHSGLSPEERRDPSNNGYQLAEVLMTMAKPKVSEDQVELFRDTLVSRLMFEQPSYLGVDYGPDMILRDALQAANVDSGMGTLPIKSSMWIGADKVSVRYGYGAPEEVIYSATP